jgi:pSer/pThr/pTyr-binding forkhead associated (FHA) protein
MQEAPQCPICKTGLTPGLPYCPGCGSQLDRTEQSRLCPKCSSAAGPHAKFCPECGYGLDSGARAHRRTSSMHTQTIDTGIILTRLDETGEELSTHEIVTETTTLGRDGADIDFSEDRYLSPRHAELALVDGVLSVRDLGSRNGTWFFIEAPYKLADGDLVLVGSQIIRFRRLGYPGPHPPEADATRRLGSLTPSADIATLTQVRADGRARDTMHLSPGRNITIGRDQGDWIFSYDPSMSGLHAQIQSDDADFVLIDADSRNGVAVNVRGTITLNQHSRILIGDKMLRVTLP